jgi:hypothetical protein
MALITDIRKNVTESMPVLAVVGATDFAVGRVRAAAASAANLQAEVEKAVSGWETLPAQVQAQLAKIDVKTVQNVPALAVSRAVEAAGRAEKEYEKLAARGKELIERVTEQPATQEFVKQGKVTISRTKAAVTVARKAVDDTTAAARSVVTVGRREAGAVVDAVEAEVADSVAATEKVVAQRTRVTRSAAKAAATTARKRAASTRTATKGAVTSARKAAEKGVAAAEAAAESVGTDPEAPVSK